MASGEYWSGLLPSGSYQDTGAVPAGKVRTVSILLINTSDSISAAANIYVSTGASPVLADLIDEPDLYIPPGGVFRLSGEIVDAGKRVVLKANTPDVKAAVTGFEEAV